MKIPLLLTSLALAGAAVSFTLDWSTIDAGGGRSAGGNYTVNGSIGQPDAGRMTGGSYTLEGGFLSVPEVIQTPGAPLLTITRNTGQVLLSWPAPSDGWRLESSPELGAPWTTVPGSPAVTPEVKSMTVTPAAGKQFFRLAKP